MKSKAEVVDPSFSASDFITAVSGSKKCNARDMRVCAKASKSIERHMAIVFSRCSYITRLKCSVGVGDSVEDWAKA